MPGIVERSETAHWVALSRLVTAIWLGFLLCPGMLYGQARIIVGQQRFDNDNHLMSGQGVYLPTERTMTRGVRQAEQDLEAGQYSRAVEFLGDLLQRDEDLFLSAPDATENARGIKQITRQLIRDLPPQGRVVYEVQFAARARKQLATAIEDRDDQLLAQVARDYFDTPAGYEAAWLLAQLETDRGHWSVASLIYQDLLVSVRARRALGPQLLVQAALHQIAGGNPKRAHKLLDQYLGDYDGLSVQVDGRNVPISQLESRLFDAYSSELAHTNEQNTNWTHYRGNLARSSEGLGGLPLLRERWRVRVVNEPRAEGYLESREGELRSQGLSVLPVASPIAIDDVVIFSTPRNVVAVDWKTGKRIWETRPDPDDHFEEIVEGLVHNEGQEEGAANGLLLDQRVWEDAVTVALSSDGERVYTIRGAPFAPDEPWNGWGGNVLWNAGSTATPTNRLSAFDLATEGKLVWEIDGSRTEGPFENVFFLSAPMALDGTLYILGEVNSAVYLFALEPSSGKLVWKQQVASLERGVGFDPPRRFAGANLAYADGVLVCPTGAGLVVGINLLSRSLEWAYSIKPDEQTAQVPFQVWQRARARQMDQETIAWHDTSAVISDGRVLLTSPESNEIHCFDLASGRPIWKVGVQHALFVACVVEDVVLVVEPRVVRGIRLSDGSLAWGEAGFALPAGAMPSGKGFVSEGRYFLPLSTGEVASINVVNGEIDETIVAPESLVLGNLIYHRDAVVSQNALFLDKFEQADALLRRAQAALEQDSGDAAALRDLGELSLARGELDQARDYLIRAHDKQPDDRMISELLTECLLTLVTADFSRNQADLELLRSLIRTQHQEIQLLRAEIQGHLAAGKPREAFGRCLRLMEVLGPDTVVLTLARQYEVRSDVWIREQLAAIWSAAAPDQRREIEEQLASWRATSPVLAIDSSPSQRTYFGTLPDAEGMRLELAQRLIVGKNILAAELQLLDLVSSDQEDARNGAIALLAELLYSQGREMDAKEYEAILAGDLADQIVWKGQSGSQWLRSLRVKYTESQPPRGVQWPDGNWSSRVSSRKQENEPRDNVLRQLGLRELRIEQTHGVSLDPLKLFVNGDQSLLVGYGQDGEVKVLAQLANERGRLAQQRILGTHYAARLGHLIVVSMGSKIIALDTWQSGQDGITPIAWSEELLSERRFGNQGRVRNSSDRSLYDLVRSDRKRLSNASGHYVGVLGPVTPHGIVYQVDDRLTCVDPLTGETLWSRRDIPPGCELFGDAEFVCAIPPGKREGYILATSDGRLLEQRTLPAAPWLMTSGSRVVSLQPGSGRLSIAITEAITGDELLHTDCDAYAQFKVLEPNRFALMEPSGRFRVFDVGEARVVFDEELAPESSLRDIHIMTEGDRLFLFVNREIGAQHNPHLQIGIDYPLMSGPIYAFDLARGEQIWSAPATVAHRGIALSLPEASPLICLVDRVVRQGPSGSKGSLRILCLEKDTGRSIYWDDAFLDTAGGQFEIRVEPEKSAVVLETSSSTIRLTRRAGPRPPEPPAQEEVESQQNRKGGLGEIGRKMIDVIQNALEDGQGVPQIDADEILEQQEVE